MPKDADRDDASATRDLDRHAGERGVSDERAANVAGTGDPLTSEGSSDVTGADEAAQPLPQSLVEAAERLTRLARAADDPDEAAAYREDRDARLARADYVARIREETDGDVLVLYPDAWVEDGTVYPDRIEDLSRGIEVRLSGAASGDDWAAVDAANRDLVERVRDAHGDDHAANAAALADFAGNHYAKRIQSLTRAELEEFLLEYYPRNVWPPADQRELVDESLRKTFDVANQRFPLE